MSKVPKELKNKDWDSWCETDGEHSLNGSRYRAGKTKFIWRIKNYSQRVKLSKESFSSSVFTAIGPNGITTKWKMELLPKDAEGHRIFISLRNVGQTVIASYSYYVLDKNFKKTLIKENFEGDTDLCSSGYTWDLGITELDKECFSSDDTLTLGCEISILESFIDCVQKQKEQMINDLENAYNLKVDCGLDVTVKCGDSTFPCSKYMLTARSPVFSSMFQSNMKESQTNNVNIEDLEPPVVAEMLNYIHTGNTPNIKEEALCLSLLTAADRYQLEDLKSSCVEELISMLDLENMCRILILSEIHGADKLKKAAFKFVTENLRTSSDKWKEELVGYPSLLIEILSEKLR